MAKQYEPKVVLDPFSILFVSRKGVLKRIFCPFWVKCTEPVDLYQLEQRVVVDMVKTDTRHEIVYVIKGKSYQHYFFEITI